MQYNFILTTPIKITGWLIASTCGDNCAEWILKIAKERKVIINLHHLMDFGPEPFKAKILNTNKIIKNMAELVFEAGEFV